MASGGKVTTLYGGVPVVVDGQVIGAVGVGGGSGEQDAQVARAGVQAFTEQLAKPAAGSGRMARATGQPRLRTREWTSDGQRIRLERRRSRSLRG